MFKLHEGDCLEVLKSIPDYSVDSIVTDPPYELGFMGKKWDATGIANSVDMWREALMVLKPGGHLLAFSGSRTYHRMTCAIEDAGFEIRDQIMWLYGSGFPKSHDVSKSIDKAAGAEREVVGYSKGRSSAVHGGGQSTGTLDAITAPTADAAKQWQGWGTALKPAHEPICVARKPFKGTVAANVLEHGTGALNIDGGRIPFESESDQAAAAAAQRLLTDQNANRTVYDGGFVNGPASLAPYLAKMDAGRWPANVIHDGLDEPWAKYFYCAKASKADREAGLSGFDEQPPLHGRSGSANGLKVSSSRSNRRNNHPPRKTGHPHAISGAPGHPTGWRGLGPLHGIGLNRQSRNARRLQIHRHRHDTRVH